MPKRSSARSEWPGRHAARAGARQQGESGGTRTSGVSRGGLRANQPLTPQRADRLRGGRRVTQTLHAIRIDRHGHFEPPAARAITVVESRRTLGVARRFHGPLGSAARGIASQPASPRPPCGGAGLWLAKGAPTRGDCATTLNTRGQELRALHPTVTALLVTTDLNSCLPLETGTIASRSKRSSSAKRGRSARHLTYGAHSCSPVCGGLSR
jgi:hypothetical protein